MKKILVFLLIAGVCGCATVDINSFQPGMTKQEVIAVFGEEPQSTAYKDGAYTIYYNIFGHNDSYSLSTHYFVFKNNKLIEWSAVKHNQGNNQTHTHVVIPFPSGK